MGLHLLWEAPCSTSLAKPGTLGISEEGSSQGGCLCLSLPPLPTPGVQGYSPLPHFFFPFVPSWAYNGAPATGQ